MGENLQEAVSTLPSFMSVVKLGEEDTQLPAIGQSARRRLCARKFYDGDDGDVAMGDQTVKIYVPAHVGKKPP